MLQSTTKYVYFSSSEWFDVGIRAKQQDGGIVCGGGGGLMRFATASRFALPSAVRVLADLTLPVWGGSLPCGSVWSD